MKKTLIVASRGGALAEIQTGIVISSLKKICPDIEIYVKKITSAGDKDRRTTLWELKSTGFFTTALEDALIAGQADAAVHSFKDLPTAIREGLTTAAVLDRQFAEDCLVSAKPVKSLDGLPEGAKVGTSSLRRTVQLKRLREDLECLPIRGNINTRLRKLAQGQYDAVILARAGLERLGLAGKISIVFDPAEFIPAPAQGALAVEIRADDIETSQIVSRVDERQARIATTAERLVFSALGCGCHAPAGVFARLQKDAITISAFYCDPDGKNYTRADVTGPVSDAEALALSLAGKIKRPTLNVGS